MLSGEGEDILEEETILRFSGWRGVIQALDELLRGKRVYTETVSTIDLLSSPLHYATHS